MFAIQIHKSSSICIQEKWNELERKFRRIDIFDPSVYTGICGLALLKMKKDDMSNEEDNKAYYCLFSLLCVL